VSVRTRIAATVAALVLLALSAAGLIIYLLESARVESAARDQATQEIAEFRTLQSDGRDPTTAEPFTSAQDLLGVFLSRNVPSDDELLIGWIDGRARFVSAGRHGDLARDPALERAVAVLVRTGTERTIDTTYGEVLVTVQPVRESTGGEAALVVATLMDDARADLRSLVRTYAVVSLLSLAGIVAIAAWQAGRLLAPIRRLNETARVITATDLSARLPVRGNDDITALTVTFNEMLDRLEAAFVGQRQFLDDAGHELKTPLTVLRGHLELLDHEDPAELAETRALLLDEVDRMGRLVGDLILLAKSRRPDFLTTRPTDLGRLTHALLAKARALAEREWLLDAEGEVVVGLDEQRITQAVLQLADNAVKHTREGDTIAIGSSYDGAAAHLWVRDTGDGVPEQDREHVFERFGRSTVRPDDEGFGLGLSIVRAIAAAHGGSVRVTDPADDQPDGAMFVITLPHQERPWPRS
jgi:two-component system, OmpR family, sensor kinase